jgi:primosomal protein N'
MSNKKNNIKYTQEVIFHFTCPNCSNWWSYANQDGYVPIELSCPFCKHHASTEKSK